MSDSDHVVHYPLVRVRGGAAMLLAALVGGLSPPAQVVLRRALWVISLMTTAKVQRTAVLIFARRLLLPLLTDAFPTVPGAQNPGKTQSSSATLIKALVRALVVYSFAEKLLKAHRGASSMLTAATAACMCNEEELLRRLLVAVADADARSLSSMQRWVTPRATTTGSPRVYSAFFSTTTRVALKAYLRHLHSPPRTSRVTIFVPGLLTAPWTTHLLPLLRDICSRQGTAVVGYDICVDADHYDIDLRHLRHLILQKRRSTADSHASPPPSAMSPTGVLVLASIRGRRVRNGAEACVFAKMNGWQIVELCVPTLPVEAIQGLEPQPRPLWMGLQQAQRSMPSVRPDLCLTAFDDAGMYGGAVVELCSGDSALLAHMKSQCQRGQVESGHDGTTRQTRMHQPSYPSAAVTLRTLPFAVASATLDAASGTNESIDGVWCPWARRLCIATLREADMLRHGSVAAQEALVALRRFPGQALSNLSVSAKTQVQQFFSPRKSSPQQSNDGSGGGGPPGGVAHSVSAEAPVEQRTTYITSPLPPLAAVVSLAAQRTPANSPINNANNQGMKESPTLAKKKLPDRAAPRAWTASEGALTNGAVEWRIRLRWSFLLMSQTFGTGGVPRVANDASFTTRTSAAYLSLWSFVAQLPPWVVAVSAADDGETVWGEHRSSCCVEASATALLVRLAHPASPQAVADLLRDEALIEATAVRPRTWNSVASAPDATAVEDFKFEEAVVFIGCAQATRLSEELLYLPLSPNLPLDVRTKMLRVMWDKVPHTRDDAHAPEHSHWRKRSTPTGASSNHVQATLNSIYRTYLPQAQRECVSKTPRLAAAAGNAFPRTIAQDHSRGGMVSARDAKRVQQFLFDGAFSSSSSASWGPTGTVLKPFVQACVLQGTSNL
ncbi:hypothetical protein JKF63_02132 [Porcisia hertigi]|uniref:Uncharacterized protein n=1 Tax=Porcisia hertigi TaxID=2761500 RepID=A0A836L1S5_9TRYP|nr:hypothetical protein JKF63_02132 [Porcisia hertigi]